MTLANVQQRYRSLCTAILTSLSILLLSGGSLAQVTTTIIPDRTLGTEVNQNAKLHEISGGARPEAGPNLFHSFDRFHVGTEDTAHFIGEPGIENIIGRITGPEASRIDGTLQADASLFLLNPQGILFRPDATLNIHGSFHASTADVLRLADGAVFSTRLTEKSTLTVASPSAFGFLHAKPAGIAIQGSHLEVPEGKTLSLVGGDMTIAGDGDPSSGPPTLAASGGRINLTSVASSGNVVFDPASPLSGIDVGSVDQMELGQMDILAGTLIDVSGEGGGAVVIRGGRLRMDRSWLFANTLGKRNGVKIGVDIEVDALLLTNEALVTTDVGTSGTGNAGNLSIVARHLRVDGGSQIGSSTYGPGHGGTVTVQTTELTMEGAAPDNRSLSGLFANAQGKENGAGDAGGIVVEAQQVHLAGGAQIVSASFGPGKGGTVTVRATEVNLKGAAPDNRFLSGLFTNAEGKEEGAGDAGDIVVEAQQVSLSGGAQIGSITFGPGKGGTVTVQATEVNLKGATTDNRFSSGLFASAEGKEEGAGDAGTILVDAGQLTLSGGARIFSATYGPGSGGTVTVHATEVNLEGAASDNSFSSGIVANALGPGEGAGDAGDIVVEAQQVRLAGGAQIGSGTFGPGTGGTVTVQAKEVNLEGATTDNSTPSGLFANAQGEAEDAGDAGEIVVEAQQVRLSAGAQIGSITFGPGKGGTVTMQAKEVHLEGATTDNNFSSGIFVNARGEGEGTGDAGTILVDADQLTLAGGARISSTTSGPGRGGTIAVRATTMTLEGATPDNNFSSGIFANAEGEGEEAGDARAILSSRRSRSGSPGEQKSAAPPLDQEREVISPCMALNFCLRMAPPFPLKVPARATPERSKSRSLI